MLYRIYRQKIITLSKQQQEASRRESLHVRGPVKAPITIEEFGDFQCPPCARLSEPLNDLLGAYSSKVQLVFREFPLVTHNRAQAAAHAAEAAGLQGKFWEMHDLLYREQENWSKSADVEPFFTSYARLLGLEPGRFKKDFTGEIVRARVAADQKRAAELGVTVTPSIFLNGKMVTGPALSPSGLREAVKAELAQIPAP